MTKALSPMRDGAALAVQSLRPSGKRDVAWQPESATAMTSGASVKAMANLERRVTGVFTLNQLPRCPGSGRAAMGIKFAF
jgi:hypothetical protein